MAADWRDRIQNIIWPKMGYRRYGVYLAKRVARISATPHAIGAGVAAGAAVSMFPLIGIHFLLGFALAYLTRGNMLAAAIGTAWGNPLTFPLFFAADYRLGAFLTGQGRVYDPTTLGALGETIGHETVFGGFERVWPIFKTMMVGALPLAAIVYVGFYFLTRWLVARVKAARAARRARRHPQNR